MKKILYIVVPVILSFILFVFSIFGKETIYTSINYNISNAPVIIIDAGHGGFDAGAVSVKNTLEKDINLSVSKYLQEYLSALGFKTVMTREDDISLEDSGLTTIKSKKTSDIHNRMKIMENTDNSIFVSIHQNKFPIEKYYGIQVFYSPMNNEASSILAQCIQNCVVNTLQPENKRQIDVCSDSVYLIHNAVRPAVLVECGFLSNEREAELLNTAAYQKCIAFCIAMGIQNYIVSRNE